MAPMTNRVKVSRLANGCSFYLILRDLGEPPVGQFSTLRDHNFQLMSPILSKCQNYGQCDCVVYSYRFNIA